MKRTANKVFDDAVNIVKSHIDDLQHDKEFLIEELRGYLNKPDRKYRSWAVDKESLLDIANDIVKSVIASGYQDRCDYLLKVSPNITRA